MSYLKKVEGWREDTAARLARFGKDTPYGQMLQRDLDMYDNLIARLKEINKPQQGSLPIREPGDE